MATTTNYLLPNGTDISTLFQPFTPTSTSIFSTTQILSLATNSTGSILAGVAKNSATIYYSFDSGTNWGTAITLPITATHIAISDNGTYQLICGHNSTYNYYAYSTSGGGAGTWTAKVMPGSTGLNISVPTGVAISSNGQYMYVCGDTILLYSQNFAGSFTTINNLTSQIFTGICCSSNGKYVYTCSTLGIKISTDNGSLWTNNSFSGYFTNICCNSSGNVVMVTEYNVGTFVSINYGATWTKTLLPATKAGFVTRGASGLNYTGYIVSCSNSTGQYLSISFYSSGTTGNIYTSYNYGKNWFQLNSPVGTYKNSFLATNSNRSILYLTDLTNIYKYTFSPLQNVNYMNIDGTDLSQLFVGYTSGNHVQPTGYLLTNGTDLNTIFQANPSYTYFSVSGTATSQIINGYNLITVTKGSGTINILKNIPSAYIICVGGGGGGNAGSATYVGTSVTPASSYIGGGGSGGASCYLNTSLESSTTINIVVGNGGAGGTNTNSNGLPGSGGDTTLQIFKTTISGSIANTLNVICNGGNVTSLGSSTIDNGGSGGTTTVLVGSNITTSSGGNGGNADKDGSNSSTSFTIPSSLSLIIQSSYGGGGGGGKNTYGGTAGNKGAGGTAGAGNSSGDGSSATFYGDGGGGGGYTSKNAGLVNYGGAGAPGIAYIYFPLF